MANSEEDDILRDAIIGTEREIFGDAFGQEDTKLDPSGDRSVEAMGEGLEGQHEPEDEDELDENADEDPEPSDEPDNAEPAAEAKGEAERENQPQGRVPAGRLREEAERARAAIAERDSFKAQLDAERAASQKAVSDLTAKLDVLLALQRQTGAVALSTDAGSPKAAPDLFEDPNAFAEHLNKGVEERFDRFLKAQRDREINASLEAARTKYGQAYEDGFSALKGLDFRNPDNVALVRRMEAAPNPGEAVVSWHKRNEAMREVGGDIASFKARIADETRKQLMADPEFRKELVSSLRGEAMGGDQGRMRTETRLPRSLSQTAGGNSRAPNDLEIFDGSDRATFDAAWTT